MNEGGERDEESPRSALLCVKAFVDTGSYGFIYFITVITDQTEMKK